MTLLTYAIVIRALLSFFPHSPNQPLIHMLYRVTEPMLQPFRRIRFSGAAGTIDFSPLIALLVLQFIVRPLFFALIRLLMGI
ncbi:MAG TPA: YggT family protein [Desulfitobacteriaceae bacterium]|nr:YggT family protein [Desulfitobacteriaceae bacterium]